MEPRGDAPGVRSNDDDAVPIFGTWARIYTAVVVSALAVMVFVAVFSLWKY